MSKRLPLPAQGKAERDTYRHQREAVYDRIWQELPEIVEGVIERAKGVKVSEDDGTTVYQQAPDLEAARFLIERVDGKAKGSVSVDGNVVHSWDALLEEMVSQRGGAVNVTPVKAKAQKALPVAQPAELTVEERARVVQIDREAVLASLLEPEKDDVGYDQPSGGLFDILDGDDDASA